MDADEAHRALMTATGGQPYAPRLEEPVAQEPSAGQALDPGHGALVEPERIVAADGINAVAVAFGHATSALEEFADAARKLAEAAEEVVDQDGREIWMTAGEIELDQWTQRLTDAAAVVRRQIGASG